nr:hypothetical protein [Massilia sp. PDC64]
MVAQLAPEGCGDGELRVVQRLAGAVVAGRIAVMAGVFGEDAIGKIDDAIKLVIGLWWDTRAGALARVRQFLEEHINEIEPGRPSMDSEAIAFVEEDLIVIQDSVFTRKFRNDAPGMLDQLKSLGVLKQEQPGRHMHRFCNGAFRGYALFSKRIWTSAD